MNTSSIRFDGRAGRITPWAIVGVVLILGAFWVGQATSAGDPTPTRQVPSDKPRISAEQIRAVPAGETRGVHAPGDRQLSKSGSGV